LLVPALTSYPDRALHNQKAGAPIAPVIGSGAAGKTKALRRRYYGKAGGPQGSLYGIRTGAPLEDPGPSLSTGLPTRWLLGSPLVLGRAHHPLKAHLLCAVGQQGAKLDLKPFCRSSRARRDRSAQVSSPHANSTSEAFLTLPTRPVATFSEARRH
jgi:hypothetical protein